MSSDIALRKALAFGSKRFFSKADALPVEEVEEDIYASDRDVSYLTLIAARIRYLKAMGERP